ncbi:MAG: hypothetical protein FGM39_02970 [Phycisphaerales bacterium]|nr:hypothetical protein [Phycisphaerales bacterium]
MSPSHAARTAHAALGSLAAVAAALAATSADAGVPGAISVSSTVSNTALTNGRSLDINGDSVGDFTIVFFNSQVLRIDGVGTNATSDSNVSTGFAVDYTLAIPSNQTISSSTAWAVTTALASLGSTGPGTDYYAGIRFLIGANTHYGWVRFNIPQVSGWAGATAVSAAWQTTPNLAIAAGAVPAPGAVAVLIGAGLVGRRRRT